MQTNTQFYQILNDRAFIKVGAKEVEGLEAFKFLQNLVTNDISGKEYLYSLLLSNTGRYLADFFILNQSEAFYLLDTHKSSLERLIKILKIYKLRAKIDITDETDNYVVAYSTDRIKNTLSFKDPRTDILGYRTYLNKRISTDERVRGYVFRNFELDNNLYNNHKYKFAIPEGETEMQYDKSLPPEFGMDHLNAISYTKGCYVGQEVIARAKYQGVVRKHIYKIISDQKLSPNEEIFSTDAILKDLPENKIGKVCSCKQEIGIGLIRSNEALIPAYGANEKVMSLQLAPWYKKT